MCMLHLKKKKGKTKNDCGLCNINVLFDLFYLIDTLFSPKSLVVNMEHTLLG